MNIIRFSNVFVNVDGACTELQRRLARGSFLAGLRFFFFSTCFLLVCVRLCSPAAPPLCGLTRYDDRLEELQDAITALQSVVVVLLLYLTVEAIILSFALILSFLFVCSRNISSLVGLVGSRLLLSSQFLVWSPNPRQARAGSERHRDRQLAHLVSPSPQPPLVLGPHRVLICLICLIRNLCSLVKLAAVLFLVVLAVVSFVSLQLRCCLFVSKSHC